MVHIITTLLYNRSYGHKCKRLFCLFAYFSYDHCRNWFPSVKRYSLGITHHKRWAKILPLDGCSQAFSLSYLVVSYALNKNTSWCWMKSSKKQALCLESSLNMVILNVVKKTNHAWKAAPSVCTKFLQLINTRIVSAIVAFAEPQIPCC